MNLSSMLAAFITDETVEKAFHFVINFLMMLHNAYAHCSIITKFLLYTDIEMTLCSNDVTGIQAETSPTTELKPALGVTSDRVEISNGVPGVHADDDHKRAETSLTTEMEPLLVNSGVNKGKRDENHTPVLSPLTNGVSVPHNNLANDACRPQINGAYTPQQQDVQNKLFCDGAEENVKHCEDECRDVTKTEMKVQKSDLTKVLRKAEPCKRPGDVEPEENSLTPLLPPPSDVSNLSLSNNPYPPPSMGSLWSNGMYEPLTLSSFKKDDVIKSEIEAELSKGPSVEPSICKGLSIESSKGPSIEPSIYNGPTMEISKGPSKENSLSSPHPASVLGPSSNPPPQHSLGSLLSDGNFTHLSAASIEEDYTNKTATTDSDYGTGNHRYSKEILFNGLILRYKYF
jgi:hypothetical protein